MVHSSNVLIFFFLLFSFIFSPSFSQNDRKTFIIHMDKTRMPSPFSESHQWYTYTLSSLSPESDNETPPIHIYTYSHALSGFSAVLSPSQLKKIQEMPGHIATYEDTMGYPLTTHSYEFLGLNEKTGIWPVSGLGDDVIIGIVDSGIWPESASFRDEGMPPVPDRWRGACESGERFNSSNCNKKLIGARSFRKAMKLTGINITDPSDFDSPRDYWGHGTHVASIAGGSAVAHASYSGYAPGLAVGMAPKARIAVYKVMFYDASWVTFASDTLAGIDQAIADGVDIISLSIGFGDATFYKNPIAIGSFSAMEKGIFVSCGAGNRGHKGITNGAPWVTSVGAGTTDRDLVARATFGDGDLTVLGRSVYPINLFISKLPLYFGLGDRAKESCRYGSLDPSEVAGKFIFCDDDNKTSGTEKIQELKRSGAVGAIINMYLPESFSPDHFNLPFLFTDYNNGERIKEYVIGTKNATVSVKFQVTVFDTRPAPQVANFSSRGPNRVAPWVLKPDILAPGVDVLGAWSPESWAARIGDNFLLTDYMILSGTSMSSPHVAGVAALVKAAHRDWSPDAIRSAMMTTADVADDRSRALLDQATGLVASPLDFGAGQVNPNRALDPGLVYDIGPQGYVDFLCAMNYSVEQIHTVAKKSKCSCENATLDLNYPSFSMVVNYSTNTTSSYTFKRVLFNVEDSHTVYEISLVSRGFSDIDVHPSVLTFDGKHSKAEFNMTVLVDSAKCNDSYAYLSWKEVNGTHVVRSPIVCVFSP